MTFDGLPRYCLVSNRVAVSNGLDLRYARFMYETTVGRDIPSREDYKYGVEQLFISLLAKSKFRTKVH